LFTEALALAEAALEGERERAAELQDTSNDAIYDLQMQLKRTMNATPSLDAVSAGPSPRNAMKIKRPAVLKIHALKSALNITTRQHKRILVRHLVCSFLTSGTDSSCSAQCTAYIITAG
jgi:hypothetical protein